MGKKQHQKDKLYLTCSEWTHLYGGKKPTKPGHSEFRRLPFDCCSLSLQPVEHPLCTKEGVIFDLMNIVPWLKRYNKSPVTWEPMTAKDLFKLNFHKNSSGKYHCPVTFKVFNENTHIAAVKQSGNVFAYEAIERLNIKPKFFKDLITNEDFTRKDIITIQDPTNLDKFNMSKFYHLKNNLKLLDEDEEEAKKDPKYHLKFINPETRDILQQLDKDYKAPEKQEEEKRTADKFNAAHYSSGRVAASFTSTAITPETQQDTDIIDEDIIRYERVKKLGKKGYVRAITNKGTLNLELHCEMVPKTCENFIKHCGSGYYNGTIFHRSIRNFMIQGGDPDGTGLGGQSIWGKPFKDEFKPNLCHTGRGVLSMANAGADSNKSQFFITFRSCKHLDYKHAIFGRVVGGLDTLQKMEKVEADKNDRPTEEIILQQCVVFVNPYDEVDEMLSKEREDEIQKEKDAAAAAKVKKRKPEDDAPQIFTSGIGKYINPAKKVVPVEEETEPKKPKKSKVVGKSAFGNFSGW